MLFKMLVTKILYAPRDPTSPSRTSGSLKKEQLKKVPKLVCRGIAGGLQDIAGWACRVLQGWFAGYCRGG